jgi:TonB family protein
VALIVAMLLQMGWPLFGGAPAQSAQTEWTDAVRLGNGVTRPRVITQVKPTYTEAAMAAKVEGTVSVECVVETDGSVRRARVVRSLGFGLDQTSIDAAKAWKFEPGTKDGRPVPVLITLELAFVLQKAPPDAAPFALPEAFDSTAKRDPAAVAGWDELQFESGPLVVKVERPNGWRSTMAGTPGILFSLQTVNPVLGASMLTPMPTPNGVAQVGPASMADLQQFGRSVAATFKRQLAATGQAMVADRLWFWYDLGFLATPLTHMWVFSTVTEGYQITVTFVIGHPDGTDQKDWEAEAHQVGPTFTSILERLSFQRK